MGLGFFKSLAGLELEKGADEMMAILANWMPNHSSEAEIRMISDTLSKFCVIRAEAKKKMDKEVGEADQIKAEYADKLALAKLWQSQIENPATEEGRRKQLEGKIPGLMQELRDYGPRIDKEVREAEIFTQRFQTYDQVVVETDKKLQQRISRKDVDTAELEIAEAERDLAEDKVNAARVIAGLQKATDSLDVVSNAISKKKDKLKAETEGMMHEAELLSARNKGDDFVAAELAAMKGAGNTSTSIADQLAELEAKLK